VIRDGFGHADVGSGGEHEFATGRFLLFEPGDERFVIRKIGGINLDLGGDGLFEVGAPPQQGEHGEESREGFLRSKRTSDSHIMSVRMSVPSKSTASGVWRLAVTSGGCDMSFRQRS
jgi:hypothetical protein